MYFGWISCNRSQGAYLRSIGVTLGKYDRTLEVYRDCIVSDEAKEKIDDEVQKSLAGRLPPPFLYLLDYHEEMAA